MSRPFKLRPAGLMALLAICTWVFTGCGPRDQAASGSEAYPKHIRIGFQVQDEELAGTRTKSYNDIAQYLSEKLGVTAEAVRTTGYGVNIEAMRAGKMDLCSFSPLPYLLARQTAQVEPLVVPALPGGEPVKYYSLLITHPDSGIKSMEDVKAKTGQITMAFANPASTSGHLIPRAYLETLGIVPEKQFKRVFFSENHVVSVHNVQARKIELAAVTKTTLDRLIERGAVKSSDIVVLWQSEPLVQSAMTVRRELPEEFKRRAREALLALPVERPDIWQEYVKVYPDPRMIYAPGDDRYFDEYRRIAKNVSHLKLLE